MEGSKLKGKISMSKQIKYSSTRGGESSLTYEDVLLSGLARDGGLFMPEEWPHFSYSELEEMKTLDYAELATKIMKPFIEPCLSEKEILEYFEKDFQEFIQISMPGKKFDIIVINYLKNDENYIIHELSGRTALKYEECLKEQQDIVNDISTQFIDESVAAGVAH